jgi:HD-GYP domain-containing protein (c-di-GMP phosphodiesterase class II)
VSDLQRATRGYVLSVTALAVLAFVVAGLTAGPPQQLSWLVAMVAVAAIAAVSRPQAIGAVQVSVSGIVQIASIPLLGPVGAALVAALPVLLDRNEPVKRWFNASQRVCYVLAGAAGYWLAGGRVVTSTRDGFEPALLAVQVTTASVSAGLVNAVLLSGVLHLSSAGSMRVILTDLVRQIVSPYASYALAAYLLVLLWAPAGLGWVSAVLFLPSILVIQWGLHTHSSEWAIRHEVLNPFVVALDLRQPGAAEGARLVGGAATAIATGVGLTPVAVDEVTTAARLRDVGNLALQGAPEAIVRRDHAAAAQRVLGSVEFLDGPMSLIAAHHERVDGQGRPQGLIGEDIPIGARVVAVADTWGDAVASGLPPDGAVSHCEALVGQSLDASCVAALRRALELDQLPQVTDR